jgi:hypothetical protein
VDGGIRAREEDLHGWECELNRNNLKWFVGESHQIMLPQQTYCEERLLLKRVCGMGHAIWRVYFNSFASKDGELQHEDSCAPRAHSHAGGQIS